MSDGITRLARSIRLEPDELPAAAHELTDEEAELLAGLVEETGRRRGEQLRSAIEDGLTLVPRPLRRPVMKVLGV